MSEIAKQIKKLIFCVICTAGCYLQNVQGQEALLVIGGDLNNGNVSVAYSVGQLSFSQYNSVSGTISEGVQHPWLTFDIIDNVGGNKIQVNCTVYPNPVIGFLTLIVDHSNLTGSSKLEYKLFDISGNILSRKVIRESRETVDMTNLVSGTYLLKVASNALLGEKKHEAVFKIIKN